MLHTNGIEVTAGVRRITSFGTVTKRLEGFDPTWFDYRVGQPIKYPGPKK